MLLDHSYETEFIIILFRLKQKIKKENEKIEPLVIM